VPWEEIFLEARLEMHVTTYYYQAVRNPDELVKLLVGAVRAVVVHLRPDAASMGAYKKANPRDKGIEHAGYCRHRLSFLGGNWATCSRTATAGAPIMLALSLVPDTC